MRPFRFRAAAALEVRRKQERDAATLLARAQARFSEAQLAFDDMEQQRRRALEAAAAQAHRGIDESVLFWHRNWIHRLKATADGLNADVRRQSDAVAAAERAWRVARQKCLALDRLRDRALARHNAKEHREELKVIDELARLRFTTPNPGGED